MTDSQFILSVLEDGEPHTQADLLRRSFQERNCGLTVHSRIADLRNKGHLITCERVPGADRGEAWRYQLLGSLSESDRQSLSEPSLSTDGSLHGHAHGKEEGRRSDSESEPLFEVADYGMGGRPEWA